MVLGAGGFIGRRLSARLAAIGAQVTGLFRPGTGRGRPEIRHVEADLAIAGVAADAVSQYRPAIVFNLAGYGVDPAERDPELAHRLNTGLVSELAERCGQLASPAWRGLHLVHAGSALEYGTAGGDLAETTTESPTTLYGQTKLAGARALASAVEAGRILGLTARLFTVYGPGEHPGRLLPSLLRAATHQDPVALTTGTQRRDFTYLDDVVDGLLRLGATVDDRARPIVNLATGSLTPVREFVLRAAGVIGLAPDRLRFGALPDRPEEMFHDPVDISRLAAATGWTPPTTIEAGVGASLREFPTSS